MKSHWLWSVLICAGACSESQVTICYNCNERDKLYGIRSLANIFFRPKLPKLAIFREGPKSQQPGNIAAGLETSFGIQSFDIFQTALRHL